LNDSTLPAGDYLPTSLLGSPLTLSLVADQQGGFHLQVDSAIPAYSTIILQLKLK
jgi:hypothetical protein